MIDVLIGFENMERDYQNLLRAEEGMGPLLRLYAWKEPTVSIGMFQERRDFSVPVVKRPTGGGALLHGWDLSFSVADIKERWGKSYRWIYMNFMGTLKERLERLGVNLELSKHSGPYEGYFCFYHPTLGEITHGGKKIVACAMKGLKRSFLLHGSLFLSWDYQLVESITGIPQKVLRERVISFEELRVRGEDALDVLYDLLTGLRV